MQRIAITPREDYRAKVEDLGLIWHTTPDGLPYWGEDAYYQFTKPQIDQIREATERCYEMFLVAGDHIVQNNLFHLFDIPKEFHTLIAVEWDKEPPALNYGRFDFAYDGINPPKLLEFNCDTPTSLIESSVVQWQWKEEQFPNLGQFNVIHEHLVDKWEDIADSLSPDTPIHFMMFSENAGEDQVTTAYMADIAREAGISTCIPILVNDVGWNGSDFVDLCDDPMRVIYKLYPWEWLVREDYGQKILETKSIWLEPIWKMIWSNKAILPILSELYPDSPYILKASFDEPDHNAMNFVKKPILAREGANVTIYQDGQQIAQSGGDYNEGRYVYQELAIIPSFNGNYPVIGSWVVDGQACGMGIREGGMITDNVARFVPHVVCWR